ncbi:undecaprenyl-phosphate N-acetylglucosaminyl 1-phosphate transferase [Hydrogenimonas sp.]|nr:undecaprenyl-phosphate N-acetylglucosaminyl 1-phosphate transferase [Hydrogenimonas sp.]
MEFLQFSNFIELAWWAFLLSLTTNLLVIRLSHRYSLFIDSHTEAKPQRFHELPTPRAGGIGIVTGLIFLIFNPLGWNLVISVVLAFLSGIFEDFHKTLSPKTRLLLQLTAAFSAILLTDAVVTYIGLGIELPYYIALPFSAFAIVGVMNAVNIIDGFNGLAGGVVLLILLSFGITAYSVGEVEVLQLNTLIIASLMGFLVLNFPKGLIFLGDGGAYLLGFLIALSGIFLASNYESVSPWYILCTLIYPVWEVIFSIIRKNREGKSPMEPDAYHLHMLINRHITRNNPLTALFIVSMCAPFTLLPILYHNNSWANLTTALLFIALYTLLYRKLIAMERGSSNPNLEIE